MSDHDAEWRDVVEKMLDKVWERLNPKGDPEKTDWHDWEEPAQVFAAIDRALSKGDNAEEIKRALASGRLPRFKAHEFDCDCMDCRPWTT